MAKRPNTGSRRREALDFHRAERRKREAAETKLVSLRVPRSLLKAIEHAMNEATKPGHELPTLSEFLLDVLRFNLEIPRDTEANE